MNELPNSELEIMMILWEYGRPVTRMEIDEKLVLAGRKLTKTSVLTYLSRLENRGFIKVEKQGKNNIFTAIVEEQDYTKNESKKILKTMYRDSIKNFICALYDDEEMSEEDINELQEYLNSRKQGYNNK